MPGPGGGGHGGGFGGGSHGGGFGGGGGRRGGFYGGFGPRGPYFGRRMGCLGGFLNMLLLPILLLIFGVILLISFAGSALGSLVSGGQVRYDEATFQQYADQQYSAEFGGYPAYEDNLLIVFLANEEADGYYVIAWVGDNIQTRISDLFGDEYTAFGRTVQESVNQEYYAYSLDTNLASVMEKMTERIEDLGLESSFKTDYSHSESFRSHVTNHTALSVTEETVNQSLEAFTQTTGIPTVIVIGSMEEVFGKGLSGGDVLILLILLAIIVVAIVLIVRAVRRRRSEREGDERDRSWR